MNEMLKRELNKTQLILSSEGMDYEESYEIEMLVRNTLQMILPIYVLRMNGILSLCYDVSLKQSLKECGSRVKLNCDTICHLFEAVEDVIEETKEFLLDTESILLDLEHIYTREAKFFFCYCPWKKQDILTSLRDLLEEILGELDYHDTEGVELAYHLYQNACRGNFDISEILKEHRKVEEKSYSFDFEVKEEMVEEPESQKEKKGGIFQRLLNFFLKKKEEVVLEEESSDIYEAFLMNTGDTMNHTQILQDTGSNTMFLGDVPAECWKLRPMSPGYEEFCITGESFLIGKKRDSVDGLIERDTISRIHSRLYVKEHRLFIADANSTNGTFVNGAAIGPGIDVEIFHGDRIMFADVGYECYNER